MSRNGSFSAIVYKIQGVQLFSNLEISCRSIFAYAAIVALILNGLVSKISVIVYFY